MKLMDDGINNTKVQQGLKQLQKKLVNAGRKASPSTAKRTDIGGLLSEHGVYCMGCMGSYLFCTSMLAIPTL